MQRQEKQHDRLYIVVRDDLPIGLQAAQATHAAFQFSHEHPSLVQPWFRESQYLIIVTVPDEIALIGRASHARAEGIAVSTWHEPDLGGAATAVAMQPGEVARRLCANLPLLGRERLTVVA